MRWRRCDPVQDVGGLIVLGEDAAARLAEAMAARPALGDLAVEHGEGWAATLSDHEAAMLPRVDGAIALYAAAPGWWFPVGVQLDVPDHAREALLVALAERNHVQSAAIVVPCFAPGEETSAAACLYPIGGAVPFRASALAAA